MDDLLRFLKLTYGVCTISVVFRCQRVALLLQLVLEVGSEKV